MLVPTLLLILVSPSAKAVVGFPELHRCYVALLGPVGERDNEDTNHFDTGEGSGTNLGNYLSNYEPTGEGNRVRETGTPYPLTLSASGRTANIYGTDGAFRCNIPNPLGAYVPAVWSSSTGAGSVQQTPAVEPSQLYRFQMGTGPTAEVRTVRIKRIFRGYVIETPTADELRTWQSATEGPAPVVCTDHSDEAQREALGARINAYLGAPARLGGFSFKAVQDRVDMNFGGVAQAYYQQSLSGYNQDMERRRAAEAYNRSVIAGFASNLTYMAGVCAGSDLQSPSQLIACANRVWPGQNYRLLEVPPMPVRPEEPTVSTFERDFTARRDAALAQLRACEGIPQISALVTRELADVQGMNFTESRRSAETATSN